MNPTLSTPHYRFFSGSGPKDNSLIRVRFKTDRALTRQNNAGARHNPAIPQAL